MATTTDIITSAFREANYRSIVDAPSQEELDEALPMLQGLCTTFIPMVVGVHLPTVEVTSATTLSRSARLLLANTILTNVNLPKEPQSGMLIEVVDAGHTAAVTLDGNGRFFDGQSVAQQVVLGASFPQARNRTRQWLYRDDMAAWNELTTLTAGSPFPFPDIFHDWFVMMLAIRLTPRFGSEPRAMTMQRAKEMEDFVRLHWRQTYPADTPSPITPNAAQTFAREF